MNLEELLAYEFDFEEGVAKVLGANGVTVNLDFVNTKKKAPFVDQLAYIAEPTGTRLNYKDQKILHVFRGELTTRFVVSRGDNESRAQLKLFVGRARLAYQFFHKSFNEGPHLPRHFINDMVEGRPARGHIGDQNYDWFELRHTVTLNIRPQAFV